MYPYSTFAKKWKFEQMEISAKTELLFFRDQMEIRTNGKTPPAFCAEKTKWKAPGPTFWKSKQLSRDKPA